MGLGPGWTCNWSLIGDVDGLGRARARAGGRSPGRPRATVRRVVRARPPRRMSALRRLPGTLSAVLGPRQPACAALGPPQPACGCRFLQMAVVRPARTAGGAGSGRGRPATHRRRRRFLQMTAPSARIRNLPRYGPRHGQMRNPPPTESANGRRAAPLAEPPEIRAAARANAENLCPASHDPRADVPRALPGVATDPVRSCAAPSAQAPPGSWRPELSRAPGARPARLGPGASSAALLR